MLFFLRLVKIKEKHNNQGGYVVKPDIKREDGF